MKAKRLARFRYNIWLFFIIFAIIIIALLWMFQILMFDNNYQRKKLDKLVETGNVIAQQLNTEITDELLTDAINANEAGIFTYLAYYDSDNGNRLILESIYSTFLEDNNSIQNDLVQANSWAEKAITDYLSTADEYIADRYEDENKGFSYIYVTSVSNKLIGENGFLVLRSSNQSIVDAVNVIQRQLIFLSITVIVIAFFLSWYISIRLSKPITEMSLTAKKWASGDDTVEFKGDTYEELRELAETLNYAKEGISQTGILQRDLLANVSHDLKTPLTMIKAYAEMIRDLSGDIKEKRDIHTKVIIDEADRLTMLVNDILDLSKLQNGMNELNKEIVNISELCYSVINQFNDFAEKNGYKIERDIEHDIFVECDEQKIKQVFYNIIGNSINYTGEDKKIFVKLSRVDDKVVFESIDSGKGISKEKIETIWEKYYRYADTHQRPIKGTGLGLSIVKTILESHRLRFGVISKKDVGSNFFIEFKEVDSE